MADMLSPGAGIASAHANVAGRPPGNFGGSLFSGSSTTPPARSQGVSGLVGQSIPPVGGSGFDNQAGVQELFSMAAGGSVPNELLQKLLSRSQGNPPDGRNAVKDLLGNDKALLQQLLSRSQAGQAQAAQARAEDPRLRGTQRDISLGLLGGSKLQTGTGWEYGNGAAAEQMEGPHQGASSAWIASDHLARASGSTGGIKTMEPFDDYNVGAGGSAFEQTAMKLPTPISPQGRSPMVPGPQSSVVAAAAQRSSAMHGGPELGDVLRAAAAAENAATVEESVNSHSVGSAFDPVAIPTTRALDGAARQIHRDPQKFASGNSEASSGDRSAKVQEAPEQENPGELTGAQFYKMRKAKKTAAGMQAKQDGRMFVSSPGAFISSEDRDASKHQGKFDMAALYQAQMRSDSYCMIVDFYLGRVLFSNTLCDQLFETLAPLPQREVADLIYEADRLNFSASVMYLNVGKFQIMEPQRVLLNTAKGVQPAMVTAEQLADSWWRMDFTLTGEEAGLDGLAKVPGAENGSGIIAEGNEDFHYL